MFLPINCITQGQQTVVTDNDPTEHRLTVQTGVEYAGRELSLRDFLHAQEAAGVITADHARHIEQTVQAFYQRHPGFLRSPGDTRCLPGPKGLHALSQIQKKGCELFAKALLDLYPQFQAEVDAILYPGPQR